MPEPLESELAGVTLESDALPQDFPPGDVRRRPEAPGHLGQVAAVPTHGLHQVDNEGSLLNYEFETGRGEALQTPAPSGSQTAPTATAVGVVGVSLQHLTSIFKAWRAPNHPPESEASRKAGAALLIESSLFQNHKDLLFDPSASHIFINYDASINGMIDLDLAGAVTNYMH
jgi:hypothetical protein